MLDRPYSWLMEGFPSVLPGYPAVLAGLTAVFGVDYFVYGLFNSLCWAAYAWLAVVLFRSRFDTPGQAFVLCSIVLFSPLVIHFQQHAQPNLLYALTAMAALVSTQRLVDEPVRPTVRCLLLCLVLLLPALVRKEALGLYAVVLMYIALNRRWWLAGLPVAAMVGIVAFDVAAVDVLDQGSVFRIFARRYLADAPSTGGIPLAGREMGPLVAFVFAILTYLAALVGFLLPEGVVRWAAFPVEFGSGAVPALVARIDRCRRAFRLVVLSQPACPRPAVLRGAFGGRVPVLHPVDQQRPDPNAVCVAGLWDLLVSRRHSSRSIGPATGAVRQGTRCLGRGRCRGGTVGDRRAVANAEAHERHAYARSRRASRPGSPTITRAERSAISRTGCSSCSSTRPAFLASRSRDCARRPMPNGCLRNRAACWSFGA